MFLSFKHIEVVAYVNIHKFYFLLASCLQIKQTVKATFLTFKKAWQLTGIMITSITYTSGSIVGRKHLYAPQNTLKELERFRNIDFFMDTLLHLIFYKYKKFENVFAPLYTLIQI